MAGTDLRITRAAVEAQNERELFEALDMGLKTAEAAMKAIAYARQEGRWSQMAFLQGNIREKCAVLRDSGRMPKLVLPDQNITVQ